MQSNSVGFVEAVKLLFQNFVNFKGRSRRSEYWWVCLFNFIVSLVLTFLLGDLASIWSLVIFIPTLALAIRRLHDIGKSGWWYLLIFVPLVGSILLIIWFCKDSSPETNQWGPSPKY